MLKLQLPSQKAAPTVLDEPVPGEIVGGRIRYISLCPMGKNRIVTSYKAQGAAEQQLELAMAVKASDDFKEEGLLTGIVYAPGQLDDDGNWATAKTIKAIAYDNAINGEGIDIIHDGVKLSSDQAAIVERFIVQKADPRFADLPFDPTGSWGTVMWLGEDQRAQYRSDGGWQGLSMGGMIVVDPTSHLAPAEKAVHEDDFFRTIRRLTRRALSDAPEASNIRGMHVHVMFPRPGETDFEGRLARPTFDINISGDL